MSLKVLQILQRSRIMKGECLMKKRIYYRMCKIFIYVLFILCVLASGWAKGKKQLQDEIPIQQKKTDLLAGQAIAVAYSGFRHGQHPDRGTGAVNPTDKEILEDLTILSRDSNFGLIRLYDSRDNTESVLELIDSNNINLKVMLGIWLSAEVSNHEGCPWLIQPIPQETLDANKVLNKLEIDNAIRLAKKYPNIVVAINVGNEALVNWTDHMVTQDSILAYVRKVKNMVSQPVTVADNYAWWIENGLPLVQEIDFFTVHSYPIWEGKDIDEGLAYTIENIQAVRKVFPKSKIVIGEAGWATIASEFGDRASEEKQQRYYNEITAWSAKMNITTFIFEAFDEDWKGNPDNPLGAEKHWGLFTVDRKAKLVMYERYHDLIPVKD